MRIKELSLVFIVSFCLILGTLLVFESQAADTFEKVSLGDDTIRIQSKIGQPVIDVQLRENTDVCFIDCYAVLKIHPYADIELPASPDSEFRWDFAKEKPWMEGLKSYRFEILTTVSYDVSVPIYENRSFESICYNPDNTTYDCTKWEDVQTGTMKELRYRDEYSPYSFWGETLMAGKDYTIRLSGKKKASLVENNVDWIPTIKGIGINEWKWWNSSFLYKQKVFINQTGNSTINGISYLINGTHFVDTASLVNAGKLQADADDIRFVDSGENEQRPYCFENKTSTTYGANTTNTIIWGYETSIPTTNTTQYMYYSNTTASSAENCTGAFNASHVFLFGEELGVYTNSSLGSTALKDYGGASWSSSGRYGYGIANDGVTNSYWESLTNPASMNTGTITFWFKNTSALVVPDNLMGSRVATTDGDFVIYIGNVDASGGRVDFLIYDSPNVWECNTNSNERIADGNWHFYTGRWNDTACTLYLDGVQVGIDKSWNGYLFPGNAKLRLGQDCDSGGTSSGVWDNVIFWNDTLTDDEILRLYQEGLSSLGNEIYNCDQLDNTYINNDTTLVEGLSCNVTDSQPWGIFIINASNVVLDCNGMTLNSSSKVATIGINVYQADRGFENVTIKNCILTNFYNGVQVANSTDISVINSYLDDNSYDIELGGDATDIKVINSTFETTGEIDSGSYLKRQWYVKVNVTNETGALEDAEVKIYDNNDVLEDTKNTSETGLTEEFILTQYLENFSGKYNHTPHLISVTHQEGSKNQTETITESTTVHVYVGEYSITFNVTSAEDGTGQDNVNIYCNYTNFTQGDDNNNTYGPYPFPDGAWQCTFEKTEPESFYNKTEFFSVENDATIDVVISKKQYLTIEEHNWLEEIYKCLYEGDCLAINTLLDINQTTTKIWNQFKRTDQTIVADEEFISKVVNDTNNVTINYTINVPVKEGYGLIEGIQGYDDFLPIRIHYWFLDETNTSCYSQGNCSVAFAEPYCQPLTVYTVGQINTQIDFTVDLRPSLPAGNYTIVRNIEIDPDNVWIDYGHEIIGQVQVLEEEVEAYANLNNVVELADGNDLEEQKQKETQVDTSEVKSSEGETTGMVIVDQSNILSYVSITISLITLIVVGLIFRDYRKRAPWGK